MLIVRGVNVFPAAIRDVVNRIGPALSGPIAIRPRRRGFRQDPPLKVLVELGEGEAGGEALAAAIRQKIRDVLLVTTEVLLVPFGTLPRSDYKSKLVDWSEAVED
jgi:phenylacetate-CoA ligase